MNPSLIENFSKNKDPRILKKCDHKLINILVITGDFNEGPNSKVYQYILSQLNLVDDYNLFYKKEIGTHHKFDGNIQKSKRIDWILNTRTLSPISLEIHMKENNKIWLSDHFLIFKKVKL